MKVITIAAGALLAAAAFAPQVGAQEAEYELSPADQVMLDLLGRGEATEPVVRSTQLEIHDMILAALANPAFWHDPTPAVVAQVATPAVVDEQISVLDGDEEMALLAAGIDPSTVVRPPSAFVATSDPLEEASLLLSGTDINSFASGPIGFVATMAYPGEEAALLAMSIDPGSVGAGLVGLAATSPR